MQIVLSKGLYGSKALKNKYLKDKYKSLVH